MRNLFTTYMAVAALTAVSVWAQTTVAPNYVRTTVYATDGDPDPVVATSYSDGLGRGILSVLDLNGEGYDAGNVSIITGTTFDDLGRPEKTYKATPVTTSGYTANIDAAAKGYYNGSEGRPPAEDYPYSQVQYWDDPLGRVKAAAAPGKTFSMDGDANGVKHYVRSWYFGVKLNSPNGYFNIGGFARIWDKPAYEKYLTTLPETNDERLLNYDWDVHLDIVMTSTEAPKTTYSVGPTYEYRYDDPTHFLTVTRDENGNYSQEVKDVFGRVVGRASQNENYQQKIVSQYTYDILGNLIRETPPPDVDGTTALCGDSWTKYNTLGQVTERFTPDGGHVIFKYDAAGRLDCSEDPVARTTKQYLINKYDDLGRLVEVWMNVDNSKEFPDKTGSQVLKTCYVYDSYDDWYNGLSDITVRNLIWLKTAIAAAVPSTTTFDNPRGRLVAAISFADNGDPTSNDDDQLVIDMYSYDDEGRTKTKYKSIPGLPFQKTTYTYDLQGKMLTSSYDAGAGKPAVVTTYQYDKNQRLKSVSRSIGVEVAAAKDVVTTYSYWPTGQLRSRTYKKPNGDGTAVVASAISAFNIRDWVSNIEFRRTGDGANPATFQEILKYYETGATLPQYNGNIASTEQTQYGRYVKFNYQYDVINRLKNVNATGANAQTNAAFTSNYDYDNVGRITVKHEGTQDLTGYSYTLTNTDADPRPGTSSTVKTNRLKTIAGSTTKNHFENYVYDDNGNMILDRSKKMVMEYDWRNMPVLFKFYSAIPDVLPSGGVSGIDNSTMVSYVRMVYDASGNRVLKQEYEPTVQ